MAVVATARKLAVIAWRILTSGEPYCYAQSAATAQKPASLRIASGGEKRQGGSPRGVKPTAKLPSGSKTIRSLDDTYQNEGLPTRSPLPARELRHPANTNTLQFAEKISASQVIPRKASASAQTHRSAARNFTIRKIISSRPFTEEDVVLVPPAFFSVRLPAGSYV